MIEVENSGQFHRGITGFTSVFKACSVDIVMLGSQSGVRTFAYEKDQHMFVCETNFTKDQIKQLLEDVVKLKMGHVNIKINSD